MSSCNHCNKELNDDDDGESCNFCDKEICEECYDKWTYPKDIYGWICIECDK